MPANCSYQNTTHNATVITGMILNLFLHINLFIFIGLKLLVCSQGKYLVFRGSKT